VIEVRDLTKHYGPTRALQSLSFDVRPGRVTGFLGPNGSGKSTTMRIVLGLDRADRGTVRIGGSPLRRSRTAMRDVGALLDASAVHPARRVQDHLWSLAVSNRLPRRRVGDVLGLVGLEHLADRRIGGLSLGTKQRIGIAAALLGDPATLLFDEPNNGLDPTGIAWMRSLMRHLADEGRTVFVSSHLLAEVHQVADDLVVIGAGRLVHEGPTAAFLERAGGNHVIVRTPDTSRLTLSLRAAGARVAHRSGELEVRGLTLEQVGSVAARIGVVLHELRPATDSLESAFLELTR
jgi:ABC-2 type transport system ATP-binding protein